MLARAGVLESGVEERRPKASDPSPHSEWFIYLAAGVVHEFLHLASAAAFGLPAFTASNLRDAVLSRRVAVDGVRTPLQESLIRHSGWIGSLALAWAVTGTLGALGARTSTAIWVVALEALYSDLLFPKGDGWFRCGCFGIILLSLEYKDSVLGILQQMIKVTQIRGAQSGGIVTFNSGLFGYHGVRTRVTNGKRDSLDAKLLKRFMINLLRSESTPLKRCPRVFAGHTRFATTSKATLSGTHPHRWSPAERHPAWRIQGGAEPEERVLTVETFVCHNGDLDFFEMHGQVYPLGDVRLIVEDATKRPCPSPVDSVVIAGLMELLRTQGVWQLSLRYALLFQTPYRDVHEPFPSVGAVAQASEFFTKAFKALLKQHPGLEPGTPAFREALADAAMQRLSGSSELRGLGLGPVDEDPEALLGMHQLRALAAATVDAFFDNDLLSSVREFLRCARGSFGLSVTCSLDINTQMVLAAKGQTMSVAFYPRTKLVLWGSEAAACKAAMYKGYEVQAALESEWSRATEKNDAVRIDLNDLEGEACLLSWPESKSPAGAFTGPASPGTTTLLEGALRVTLCSPSKDREANSIENRLLRLENNPLILPLPTPTRDPVGNDISDIPRILSELQRDWVSSGSLNRLSACTLSRAVLKRLNEIHFNPNRSPHTIDILLTGCEVSLWIAEQFAADLQKVFPQLSVKAISANKILGMLGHNYPVPQFGFPLREESLELYDSIVIIVSHSGGTFAPLAISKLLQAVTKDLFVVTSEWDTQISRELRSIESWSARSRIFTTGVGLRSAEPCTISVAATHQLLTQILLQLMLAVQSHQNAFAASGGAFINDDLMQLQRLNQDNIRALENITGVTRTGATRPTETGAELRMLGKRWSQHVLEIPISWMLSAAYIMITVTFAIPILSAFVRTAIGFETVASGDWRFAIFAVDGLIYLFCPQLFIWLIRLVNRRPLMHRMGHRWVVIGDIPWVSQCIEAYLSKLFASSYSNASVSVWSANPADHLVHRMTHRVSRGTLLAVGRPDGRLSAMTTAENAVLLSVNQASSIQNLGHACCESITIGNNPFRLPLSKAAVFLPFERPLYLCETDLVFNQHQDHDSAASSEQSRLAMLQEDSHGELPSPKVYRDDHTPFRSSSISGKALSSAGSKNLGGSGNSNKASAGKQALPHSALSATGSKSNSGHLRLSPLGNSGHGTKAGLVATPSKAMSSVGSKTLNDSGHSTKSAVRGPGNTASQGLSTAGSKSLNDSGHSAGKKLGSSGHSAGSESQKNKSSAEILGTLENIRRRDKSSDASVLISKRRLTHSNYRDAKGRSANSARRRSGTGKGDKLAVDIRSQPSIRSTDIQPSIDLFNKLEPDTDFLADVALRGGIPSVVRHKMQDRPELYSATAQMQALLGMVDTSHEEVFGMNLLEEFPDLPIARLIKEQHLSCELFESRVGSLQRLVAFYVMFHEMGKRVQNFWKWASFGLLGYEMDRTHSIMRVATTASPVSAIEVNERVTELRVQRLVLKARAAFLNLLYKTQGLQRKRSLNLSRGSSVVRNILSQDSPSRSMSIPLS